MSASGFIGFFLVRSTTIEPGRIIRNFHINQLTIRAGRFIALSRRVIRNLHIYHLTGSIGRPVAFAGRVIGNFPIDRLLRSPASTLASSDRWPPGAGAGIKHLRILSSGKIQFIGPSYIFFLIANSLIRLKVITRNTTNIRHDKTLQT
ncbi:hypothetical protein BHC62_08705 [Pseudomonas sp. 06C 126]|nr:hypothetical protein BHC62_08705 [Pseudomonas sp. 06C 126]